VENPQVAKKGWGHFQKLFLHKEGGFGGGGRNCLDGERAWRGWAGTCALGISKKTRQVSIMRGPLSAVSLRDFQAGHRRAVFPVWRGVAETGVKFIVQARKQQRGPSSAVYKPGACLTRPFIGGSPKAEGGPTGPNQAKRFLRGQKGDGTWAAGAAKCHPGATDEGWRGQGPRIPPGRVVAPKQSFATGGGFSREHENGGGGGSRALAAETSEGGPARGKKKPGLPSVAVCAKGGEQKWKYRRIQGHKKKKNQQ